MRSGRGGEQAGNTIDQTAWQHNSPGLPGNSHKHSLHLALYFNFSIYEASITLD